MSELRVRAVRDGLRLIEGDAVLSRVMDRPGPTHIVFDVLAACIAELAPGPRVVLLGFAGGGTLAPLRAMGWSDPIEAVDLSLEAQPLFEKHSASWAGTVRVTRMEASKWLRRSGSRWDLIVEDLSVVGAAGVTKPRVSVDAIPRLMRRRLRRGGVGVVNVLPVPGMTWRSLLAELAAPYKTAHLVSFEEYENRVLIGGLDGRSARWLSRLLRGALERIGSRQARRIAVRALLAP